MKREKRLKKNSSLFSYLLEITSLLLILVAGFLNAQQTPQQLVEKMGRGINLGNVLSAPVEGNWSGSATEQYFIDVAQAGFKNVRIPMDFFGTRILVVPSVISIISCSVSCIFCTNFFRLYGLILVLLEFESC